MTITVNLPLSAATSPAVSTISGSLAADTYYFVIVESSHNGSWYMSHRHDSPGTYINHTLAATGGIRLSWTSPDPNRAVSHIWIRKGASGRYVYWKGNSGSTYTGWSANTLDITNYNTYGGFNFLEGAANSPPHGFSKTNGIGMISITGSSGNVTISDLASALSTAGASDYYYDDDKLLAAMYSIDIQSATGGTFTLTGDTIWMYGGINNSGSGLTIQSAKPGTNQSYAKLFIPAYSGTGYYFLAGLCDLQYMEYGSGVNRIIENYAFGTCQILTNASSSFNNAIIEAKYPRIYYYDTFINCTFYSTSVICWINDSTNWWDNPKILTGFLRIDYANRDLNLKNGYIHGGYYYDIEFRENAGYSGHYQKLKDCTFDGRSNNLPVVYWRYTTGMNPLEIHQSFNIEVVDENNNAINGATVTLTNKDDSEEFSVSTGANGKITEQSFLRADMDHKDGTGNGYGDAYTTTVDYNPFTLKVIKAGYRLYQATHVLFDKVDWKIALKRAAVQVDQERLCA